MILESAVTAHTKNIKSQNLTKWQLRWVKLKQSDNVKEVICKDDFAENYLLNLQEPFDPESMKCIYERIILRKCVFLHPSQHTGISEVTYPHIRYISSRMPGFGRTYEVRTIVLFFFTVCYYHVFITAIININFVTT